MTKMAATLIKTIKPEDDSWRVFDIPASEAKCIECYDADTYKVFVVIDDNTSYYSVFDEDPRRISLSAPRVDHLFNIPVSYDAATRALAIGVMAHAHWQGRVSGRLEGEAMNKDALKKALGL